MPLVSLAPQARATRGAHLRGPSVPPTYPSRLPFPRFPQSPFPRLPRIPRFPKSPFPRLPRFPKSPFPRLPRIPRFPQSPFPRLPRLPRFPKSPFPRLPRIPRFPKSPFPRLPRIPRFPKKAPLLCILCILWTEKARIFEKFIKNHGKRLAIRESRLRFSPAPKTVRKFSALWKSDSAMLCAGCLRAVGPLTDPIL